MEIRNNPEQIETRFSRARLIEKCAAHFERRLQLDFDLLAEVGEWNQIHAGFEITLAEIHAYCRKLAALLQKARTFTL